MNLILMGSQPLDEVGKANCIFILTIVLKPYLWRSQKYAAMMVKTANGHHYLKDTSDTSE
ncbi:hypothetical protein [uncultured Nostoc sp.]|uniref:hypothetical protein n=1 Tax=uncultured Nostoc sp. TaxID=340711 RepID=UPI0035CAEB9B